VASEDHLDEVGSLGYHGSVSGGMGEKDETEHLRARFLMCERGTTHFCEQTSQVTLLVK
jgi:hypothetical protein